jgi:hypothetical protein
VPVAPANPYIKDPYKRNSWYLQNHLMGATSLYWYATDSPMGFRANSVLTLGQLTEAGGFYFALHIDKVDTSAGLPIFGLYTSADRHGRRLANVLQVKENLRSLCRRKAVCR